MNKKLKIALIAVVALNAIICVWDICTARYFGAVITGLSALYVLLYYLLQKCYCAHIDYMEAQLMEATKRERIAKQEFNKMRQRAESAEKKYKELLDDTPTRDKKGRFAKR